MGTQGQLPASIQRRGAASVPPYPWAIQWQPLTLPGRVGPLSNSMQASGHNVARKVEGWNQRVLTCVRRQGPDPITS